MPHKLGNGVTRGAGPVPIPRDTLLGLGARAPCPGEEGEEPQFLRMLDIIEC